MLISSLGGLACVYYSAFENGLLPVRVSASPLLARVMLISRLNTYGHCKNCVLARSIRMISQMLTPLTRENTSLSSFAKSPGSVSSREQLS